MGWFFWLFFVGSFWLVFGFVCFGFGFISVLRLVGWLVGWLLVFFGFLRAEVLVLDTLTL